MRLLLYRSVEDIENRLPRHIRMAMTSREIAALKDLPAKARQAFAAIASIVEKGVFAGLDITREDYQLARAAYETFASAEAWR